MTQLVLMFYEDPKADPLSEHRFHVELHFSPGAKTMDDPEFLASRTPPRKASDEDMSSSATPIATSDIAVESDTTLSNVDENAVMDSGHQSEDLSGNAVSEDVSLSDLNPSSHALPTTSTNSGQYDTAENAQNGVAETVKWTIGTSQSLESNLGEGGPTENEEFEPYDDTVYTGNELPRCAIGIDDYTDPMTDSAIGASVNDSAVSSSMSIDELPREEKLLTRRRQRLSESELTRLCGVTGDEHEHHVTKKVTESRRSKSDSDFVTNFNTVARDITHKEKGGVEINPVCCIVEEDASKSNMRRGRPKSHSFSLIENLNLCKTSQGM